MFAGEGTPEQTNRRFHYLSAGQPAVRLSTAFDSVTLYGEDPHPAARHLRQGRQLGRLDRHRGRREAPLLGLRSLHALDLGLDDDQRPGADHPRVLHERRDRPAGREAPARDRGVGCDRAAHRGMFPDGARPRYRECAARGPRRARPRAARRLRRPGGRPRDLRADQGRDAHDGPRHGAGRHPQGGSGPEHLHLLDRLRDAR